MQTSAVTQQLRMLINHRDTTISSTDDDSYQKLQPNNHKELTSSSSKCSNVYVCEVRPVDRHAAIHNHTSRHTAVADGARTVTVAGVRGGTFDLNTHTHTHTCANIHRKGRHRKTEESNEDRLLAEPRYNSNAVAKKRTRQRNGGKLHQTGSLLATNLQLYMEE